LGAYFTFSATFPAKNAVLRKRLVDVDFQTGYLYCLERPGASMVSRKEKAEIDMRYCPAGSQHCHASLWLYLRPYLCIRYAANGLIVTVPLSWPDAPLYRQRPARSENQKMRMQCVCHLVCPLCASKLRNSGEVIARSRPDAAMIEKTGKSCSYLLK